MRAIVIALGSRIRGDDAIALLIAEELKGELSMEIILAEDSIANYLSKIEGAELLIILDAVEFDGEVGEVKLIEESELVEQIATTHSIPINLISRFVKQLKIIGIKPKNVDYGIDISDEMKAKFDGIKRKVRELIKELACNR